jgi:hypothetical protein
MKKLFRKIRNGEKRQALPVVLSLLVIGGLTITPSLNYVVTSLNTGRIIEGQTVN